MKETKDSRGITLVALIITIIVVHMGLAITYGLRHREMPTVPGRRTLAMDICANRP